MRPKPPKCFYCSNPSTLLCDYVFGWTECGDRLHTCDMPTCRDHAEYRGWIHIKGPPGVGGFDSRDYCPEHCGQDDSRSGGTITDDEAERLRRTVRALAERRLMRERGVLRSPAPLPEQGKLF
ncbi:hypothetical protein [Paraburkholderia dipogonis]|uniref:hypothetical protein n=1 Tax=Paraburkholderia dipogonis TaxID=1211383 RepID=UPI0038BA48D3